MSASLSNPAPGGRPRIEYVDFIRGIAVLLVVLGHSIQYGSGAAFLQSAAFYNDWLFRGIYSFHMPLFALVSGYLFFGSVRKYPYAQIVQRQVVHLLLPVAVWTVLYQCYLQMMGGSPLSGAADPRWLSDLGRTVINSHWFFWGIFWCSVVVAAVHRWGRDRLWLYGLIGVATLVLPNDFLTKDFYLYAFIFPYFVIGYFASRIDFRSVPKYVYYAAFGLLTVLFAWLLSHFSQPAFIYTTKLSVWKEEPVYQLLVDAFRWGIGLVGAVWMLLMMYPVWRLCHRWLTVLNRGILYCGKQSAGIYIISTYLNFEILVRFCDDLAPNHLVHLLLSIGVLLVCCGVIFLLERNRTIRFITLGKH